MVECHSHERRRYGHAEAGRDQTTGIPYRLERTIPGGWRVRAAPGRHLPTRRGRLGLCPCRERAEIVIGAGADAYNTYAQRGGLPQQRAAICAVLELFPTFSRLKLMRQWAGRVDITPDTSPLMGLTPIEGLFINCGWGTGGFK